MNIISGCKNVYHFIFSAIGLIHKNLFLFGRLLLLATSSMAVGIILDHLLSYFDDGTRTVSWYVINIGLLVGLLGSALFVVYLIFHIMEKQTHLVVKKAQAEHKVRAEEAKKEEYFQYHDERPRTERLVSYVKDKVLRLTWKKDE